jgi:hypothetical protein
MPLSREPFRDDQLIRYLLGDLPHDEADRLDEESVVDDELAARLRLVEDDLVDAYASGTLTGDTLARFESYYLASPRRRRKAAFTKGFLAAIAGPEEREPAEPQPAAEKTDTAAGAFPWSLATAAVLFLAIGVLFLQDVRLRGDLKHAERQIVAADQRATAASAALEEQRRAAAAAAQALTDARDARPLATIALVLQPQTRGVGPTPIVSVGTGARSVALDLEIQVAGPASYQAALKDPATNRIVWRSTPVRPRGERPAPVVPVGVPADLLKPQHYALDLFELHPGATPEFVATYAFAVARR